MNTIKSSKYTACEQQYRPTTWA